VVQFELETAELLYSAIDFPQAKKQNNEPRQAGEMFCWRVYQNAQAHEGKYKAPSDAQITTQFHFIQECDDFFQSPDVIDDLCQPVMQRSVGHGGRCPT
jgi:hypothetical protein